DHIEALAAGDIAHGARPQGLDHRHTAAAVEYIHCTVGLIKEAPDLGRGHLHLGDCDVGMIAIEDLETGIGDSNSDVLGRILNADRQIAAVRDSTEKADQLDLWDVEHTRWLKNHPIGAHILGGADETDLTIDARLRHRHRERYLAGDILCRPFEHLVTLR